VRSSLTYLPITLFIFRTPSAIYFFQIWWEKKRRKERKNKKNAYLQVSTETAIKTHEMVKETK
jgi:hypothetical protein